MTYALPYMIPLLVLAIVCGVMFLLILQNATDEDQRRADDEAFMAEFRNRRDGRL